MSGIKDYSTTAASNNATPPNGWPENMAPSAVNDCGRQMMADIRSWYEDAEWVNLGHSPTRTGNTTFTVSGDKTVDYSTGRRIKCTDSSTIYATIVSSSYSAPTTTVTIHSDSGSLSSSLSAIALATQKPTNTSIHANLGRKGNDIASASTVDLSAATGDFVDVTGTTTITALGTMAAGVPRTVRFTGALTLTHNATSLVLPGAANITTASGDIVIFRSLGNGNWVCVDYTKANGKAVIESYGVKGADIASASTTDLSMATGDFVDITGTTTITAFGTIGAGAVRTLRFNGTLTLTHNSTSLILPGATDITTASGDVAIFRSLGSGNWLCVHYIRTEITPPLWKGSSQSFGENGYQKLPGGLIMQWGSDVEVTNAGGGGSVTYPISFPNTSFQPVICNGDNGSGLYSVSVNSIAKTGFNYATGVSNTAQRMNWIAFGN
jgi:hypothetical protein